MSIKTNLKRPELLAPAGDLEKLKFAVMYGADAIYIGGDRFGLRAKAGNFSLDEMKQGVAFAHQHHVKVYTAANIIAHNEDIDGVEDYFRDLEAIGMDAVIIADPGFIEICREVAPKLEIHLSTQASTTNAEAIKFWHQEGVQRVVLAREVSLDEIEAIKKETDVEIEAFIHGAMCISYSGRCVLSNHMSGRDANRGGCAQSCRWKYTLSEDDQPIDHNFTMGSKDLYMIEHIPDLIQAGVDSLKIEGRMKSIYYISTVVSTYKKVINAYLEDPNHFIFKEEWKQDLMKAAKRPTTTAFYYKKPDENDQIYESATGFDSYNFIGLVTGYDDTTHIATVQQRNHFKVGDEIEIFGPQKDSFKQTVDVIWNEKGEQLEAARHPQQLIRIKVSHPVSPNDMLRKPKY